LKGIDAGTFLQGMVTSDVLQLEVGEIQSSLICSNKGKIIHHLEIFRSEKDEWIVICDPGEGRAVGTILDNFHIREDLELRLLNSGEMLRIDLSGPDAEKIAEKLGYFRDKIKWTFEGELVLTAKFNLGKLPRLINLVYAGVLQKFIEQILQNEKADLIGLEAFDEMRCLEGVPRSGVDYGKDNFPQEAGLGDHISFQQRLLHRTGTSCQNVSSRASKLDLSLAKCSGKFQSNFRSSAFSCRKRNWKNNQFGKFL